MLYTGKVIGLGESDSGLVDQGGSDGDVTVSY